MIKKSKSILFGIKGTIQTHERLSTPKKTTAEPQSQIDICLSCTKPANKCKGNCFEKQ